MLHCYATPGKRKAKKLCIDMATGSGGTFKYCDRRPVLPEADVCFYGYTDITLPLIKKANQRDKYDWYYIDNAYYFGRGEYFRITKNRLIHNGKGLSNSKRFKKFNLKLKPFDVSRGNFVLLTTQSSLFYKYHCNCTRDQWVSRVVDRLKSLIDIEIKVCYKPEHVGGTQPHHPDFEEMLEGAYATVTYSSSTAVKSIIEGIPAFAIGDSYINPVGEMDISKICDPYEPSNEERLNWLGVLADNQFTREEIRQGYAWNKVRGI